MENSEQILCGILTEKREQLKVKSSRKASLDLEVAQLENEVAKLEAHIENIYPKPG